jgi:hypothetical protein
MTDQQKQFWVISSKNTFEWLSSGDQQKNWNAWKVFASKFFQKGQLTILMHGYLQTKTDKLLSN